MARVTNNGKRGGVLKGKPHYNSKGEPVGGIKAVVTDGSGKTPVELEGGEVIINKEASKKHWKELSRINQSAGNGVPIHAPDGAEDEDIDPVYEDGGNVKKIIFNPNHLPNRWIITYGVKLKKNHPQIWGMAGNIFGNEAFMNLKRVLDRGYWLDSEEWMYIKWRSYVARHAGDSQLKGVVAMIKWGDKIDKGWAYMKDVIQEEIDKIQGKQKKAGEPKMKHGGRAVSDVDCIDFLLRSESIKKNGRYVHFKDLNIFVAPGEKTPSIKSLLLISYNSGGQSNLKASDTINASRASSVLSKFLKIDIGVARIIVQEQIKRSKRFSKSVIAGQENENIVVLDRDRIECSNYDPKYSYGGKVDISEWETEEPELFKCLLTVRALVEANATVKDSFIDSYNSLYVIKYEDPNPYFDGIITGTCKTLTGCADYLEVGRVEVADKFVVVPLVKSTDVRLAKGGNVNVTNYFENTKAEFEPISVQDSKAILQQYFIWRKKRNKPDFIEVQKFGKLAVNFESVNKNKFYKSRGLSFYFVNENSDYVIRISDHWSESNYVRSRKLNCGNIASCYWTNFGEKFSIRIPSETYASEMIGGKCLFKDFERKFYVQDHESDAINFKRGGAIDLKKSDTMLPANSRFKPYGLITFNPPIIGPNGNKLMGYEWKYEWTMVPNWEGEMVSKRVSDWTQAERSAETGRDLVHQFGVLRTDGVNVTVSSESLPSTLGYTKGNVSKRISPLITSLKTLAKLKMAVAVGREQKRTYDELWKKFSDAHKPEIKEITEPTNFPWVLDQYKEGAFNVYAMGDNWIRQDNEYSYSEKGYKKRLGPTNSTVKSLEHDWISDQIKQEGVSFPMGLYELERRLERQEKRVKQALEQAGQEGAEKLQHGGSVYNSELKKGMEVEQEHRYTLESIADGSSSVDDAIKRTAEDHLKEDPRYYTKLLEMEEKMGGGGIVKSKNFRFYYTAAPPIYDIYSTETVDLTDLSYNGNQVRKVAVADRSLDAQRKRYRSGNYNIWTTDDFQGLTNNFLEFFEKMPDAKKFNDSVRVYEGVTFHSENGGFRNTTSEKLLSDVIKVLGEDIEYQDTDQAVDALKDIGVASVFVKNTANGFVATQMNDYQGEPIVNAKATNMLSGIESTSEFLDELHPLDLWAKHKDRFYRKFQIPQDTPGLRDFTDMGIKERFSDPINGHYEVILSVRDENEADKVSRAFMELVQTGVKSTPSANLTKEQIEEIAENVSDNVFDEWPGNPAKERSLKGEIHKEITSNAAKYNPQGSDPANLVEQVFSYMLEQESGTGLRQDVGEQSVSIKISDYKNPYEINRAIEELLDKNGPERSAYTPEEISFLSYYSGYGGLEKFGNFSTEELKGLLFEYYTPDPVVHKMWGLAYKYGYGSIGDNSVLEPSVGIGAFLKYAPLNVPVVANEISRYSAMIAQILYPHAQIKLMPFERNFIQSNLSVKAKIAHLQKYALVIGNPPYGRLYSKYISMGEDKYTKASNFTEYFISRGLDLLLPGGLLIYVVGAEQYNGGTLFLDSGDSPAKTRIFEKSDLIDAYRLPTKIFERTGVSSEIIVLKKR